MLSNTYSPMNLQERIQAFTQLGQEFQAILHGKPQTNAGKVVLERMPTLNLGNGWFSAENIQHRFHGLVQNLSNESLTKWLATYTIAETEPLKKIGVIMAGNIPLVGFDDFLAILISGNCFLGKTASDDAYLPLAITAILTEIEPRFANRIAFSDRLTNFDAVIA
ncbi:MAG: acyl-CoA reductase, partial [Bacteroidia bacterium]